MQIKENGTKGYTVSLMSLGCKVNKYESDSMKRQLAIAGFTIVDFDDAADFYIVNTCAVTNIAEKKSRQMLRRAKKRNPSAVVAAVGCYVNADRDGTENADYVDIVVGNNCKNNIADILNSYIAEHFCHEHEKNGTASYTDMSGRLPYEEMEGLDSVFLDHRRAYIKIQDGCNQFCSYCIIPYTRGRVRSRQRDSIIREVTRLAGEGIKEFVLTGIHISSYGTDFKGEHYDLADLVRELADIGDVRRIRLGSLEPGIVTDDFLERVKGVTKLCPHFHMSLQSACNATLARMNRKYTIEEFIDKCRLLRKYYDRPAITTDIIVGFPGETEEEFEETAGNLREIGLSSIHVFKYSVRHGTIAEKMPHQVDEQIKNDRSDRLINMAKIQKKEYIRGLFGVADELLVEEESRPGVYSGYTTRYVRVSVENDSDMINEIIPYTF